MNYAVRQAVAAGFILGVLGCGPAPGPAPAPAPAPAPPAQKAVNIEVLKVDDIVGRIDKEKGKVVVLDTWATWCIPCREEFPGLVDLHERYAKDGVVCMSVTIDEVGKKDAA